MPADPKEFARNEVATAAAQPDITSVGTLTGLHVNGLVRVKSYTLATLPTATAVGQIIYVSDAVSGAVTGALAFSNATGAAGWISTVSGAAVAGA